MINEKIVYSILLILLIGFIYNNWEKRERNKKTLEGYNLVEKFFLSDKKSLANIKKPFIWIHITYDLNSRRWDTFYSRNTMNLNQDYLYLTLRSIIEKYGNDFHICLINDNSFEKLLPHWPINLAFSPDPIRERIRNLGLSQVLYNYGGIVLPVSFIAERSFIDIYNKLDDNNILIGELLNRSNNPYIYSINSKILGCKANSKKMAEYISYLENLYSNNFTDSIGFNNTTNDWFLNNQENLLIIPSNLLGAKDNCGDIVNIDRLLNNSFIEFDNNRYGIYIDSDELLKRKAYNWFVYLNIDKVLTSNTQIGKYILVSQ
jgi:hypothetical protein